jgi:tartrate-resistant acid phosphatase type 5
VGVQPDWRWIKATNGSLLDAYFSGHEHNLQYIKPEGYTHYFVSGAGSETTPVTLHPEGGIFAKAENGFMNISVSENKMEINVISYTGQSLYSKIIVRP